MKRMLIGLIILLSVLLNGCTTKIVYVPIEVGNEYKTKFGRLELPKDSTMESISLSYGEAINSYNMCAIKYNSLINIISDESSK